MTTKEELANMTETEELLKYFDTTIAALERHVVLGIEHKTDYRIIHTHYMNYYNKLIGFLLGCKFSFDAEEYGKLCRKFNTTLDKLGSMLALYGADNNAVNQEDV